MSNIKSITPIGKHLTYDLEVDHKDHQFYLANGVLTSNSHAVAYAIDSYWTAWLLRYHEKEWLCSYLESMSSNDDNRAKAFAEIKAMGYKIVPIDIQYATESWTVIDGNKLMPSLITCKGVGNSAAQELDEYLRWVPSDPEDPNSEKRLFKTFEELLWDNDGTWRPSKFNKKAFDGLIKVGAFESLDLVGPDKMFKNYNHMHKVIVQHMNDIKKSPKKDPHYGRKLFYELIREYADIPMWTRAERIENNIKHFGTLDISAVVPKEVLDRLEEKEVLAIDDYHEPGLYWFCVTKAIPKQTKTKKNYLLLNLTASTGKTYRMFMWSWDGILKFDPYTLVIGECAKNDFGFATSQKKLRILDV